MERYHKANKKSYLDTMSRDSGESHQASYLTSDKNLPWIHLQYVSVSAPAYLEKVICQAHISKDSRIIASKGDRYTMVEHCRYWVGRYRRCEALAASHPSLGTASIGTRDLPKFHC
jgi:hypothetical protein